MTTNETSGQEPDGRIDIEITVCENGVVNVKRPESDRAHSVFVGKDGDVLRCSCKGHHYRGHCSHADAIAARPLVTASARAKAAAGQRVATDGGETVETCAQCGREGVEEYVCEACADANDERRDDDVSGSERADFGGGEASGMDDLGDPAETVDDAPETCDHCGEPPELTLTDMADAEWNDFEQLCTTCVLDVGGPGEAPDDHNDDDGERGVVDVSPCPGCGAPTTGDTCGRARCDGSDEIDETPL